MKHFGTALWVVILGISAVAIAAGFSSGASLQRAAAAPLPTTAAFADIAPASLRRSLYGARGNDVNFDPVEPHVDDIVVGRPTGWAPPREPGPRERVQLALVILGIGEDRTLDQRFAALPYALTFALNPLDTAPPEPLRTDDRALVVVSDPAVEPAKTVAALSQLHAGGILTPIAGASLEAAQLLERLGGSKAFAIDGMADGVPTIYGRARARRIPVATRDLVIDAYEEESYASYMIRQAGRLARKTGVAIAIGHAYPETYEALRRTLPVLSAEEVEIVPVGALVR